jgi:acyl carrier protein phosphodiesterase
MNHLAHAYLSFNQPEIIVGNLISDFVKGRKKFDYPAGIRHGIALHRIIDTFIDTHETTRKAKEIFRPHYRLYSGAIVDVIYDHFLATDPHEFSDGSLLDFSTSIYDSLEQRSNWFPPGFAMVFPYMKRQNWLYGYRSREGIANALKGLAHRAAYMDESVVAFRLFEEHYQLLRDCYRQFWVEGKSYAHRQYQILVQTTPLSG